MSTEHAPVPFFLQPLGMDLIKEHQQLIDDIGAQCPNPAIVNFDTMARSLVGDENSNRDVGEYFRAADAIREAFKCTVPIVHHSGYDKSHSRGATVLPSNADFEIKIESGPNNLVTATAIKQKDGPAGHKIYSRWEEIEIGEDSDGDAITSLVLYEADASAPISNMTKLTRGQQTMLTVLTEAGPKGLTIPEWNALAREAGIGLSRKADHYDFRTALKIKNFIYEFGGTWKLTSKG